MKKKPDAYELNFKAAGGDVIKCDNCGFKCVYCQYTDNNSKCPSCGNAAAVEKGHMKKAGGN